MMYLKSVILLVFVLIAQKGFTAENASGKTLENKSENKVESKPENKSENKSETYNLKFKKAPAKTASKKVAEQTEDEPAEETPPTNNSMNTTKPFIPPPQIASNTIPSFEVQLGLFLAPAGVGAGYLVGGQWNASSTFGVQLHLLSQHNSAVDRRDSFSSDGSLSTNSSTQSSGGLLGLVFTPLTVGGESTPVRFSLLAGALYVSTTRTQDHREFSAFGDNSSSTSSTSNDTIGYGGGAVTVYLNKNIGLTGYAKIMSLSAYSQLGVMFDWLL